MPEYKVESVRWLRSQAILRHRQQEFGERDIFNAIAGELEDLRQCLQCLRTLCGYVEDGSDTHIIIGQDDATKEWVLRIKGGKDILIFAPTFDGLLKAAYEHSVKEKKDGGTRNG